jgi:hypothetical protein
MADGVVQTCEMIATFGHSAVGAAVMPEPKDSIRPAPHYVRGKQAISRHPFFAAAEVSGGRFKR